MANFNKLLQSIISLGNDGKAFEVFCKWFLENDPFWKTQVEQVWLWDDWPERWGPDCGIDLIFYGSFYSIFHVCHKNWKIRENDTERYFILDLNGNSNPSSFAKDNND